MREIIADNQRLRDETEDALRARIAELETDAIFPRAAITPDALINLMNENKRVKTEYDLCYERMEKLQERGDAMPLFLYHKNDCNKIKDTYSECNCGMAEVRNAWCAERDKHE